MAQRCEDTYPTMTRWVTAIGRIEIGQDEMRRSFVRAIDEGGTVWEGREDYDTVDEALQDLEAELAAWIQHNL